MTNKEILAELKIAYENIYDIRENGCYDHFLGQLDYDSIVRLDRIKNDLIYLYHSFYKSIENYKELKVELVDFFGYVSDDISYDYISVDENENVLYKTCEDLDYYWYKDREFLNS